MRTEVKIAMNAAQEARVRDMMIALTQAVEQSNKDKAASAMLAALKMYFEKPAAHSIFHGAASDAIAQAEAAGIKVED